MLLNFTHLFIYLLTHLLTMHSIFLPLGYLLIYLFTYLLTHSLINNAHNIFLPLGYLLLLISLLTY